MANDKIVQMPLAEEYAAKLEAEATANDRVACRQAAWIIKRYFDGMLVPALPGMSVTVCGFAKNGRAQDVSDREEESVK